MAELQLGDLFKVASEDQRLLAAVGMEAPADLLRTWKDVKAVRNRIAHPVRPVLESLDGLGALLAVDSAIHSMISALQAMVPSGMRTAT